MKTDHFGCPNEFGSLGRTVFTCFFGLVRYLFFEEDEIGSGSGFGDVEKALWRREVRYGDPFYTTPAN
jgi:hypothetical protein